MASFNGGIPAKLTYRTALGPQLGSDIQSLHTRTGLAPTPARFDFLKASTVFVTAFSCYLPYTIESTFVKRIGQIYNGLRLFLGVK